MRAQTAAEMLEEAEDEARKAIAMADRMLGIGRPVAKPEVVDLLDDWEETEDMAGAPPSGSRWVRPVCWGPLLELAPPAMANYTSARCL